MVVDKAGKRAEEQLSLAEEVAEAVLGGLEPHVEAYGLPVAAVGASFALQRVVFALELAYGVRIAAGYASLLRAVLSDVGYGPEGPNRDLWSMFGRGYLEGQRLLLEGEGRPDDSRLRAWWRKATALASVGGPASAYAAGELAGRVYAACAYRGAQSPVPGKGVEDAVEELLDVLTAVGEAALER